MHLLVFVAFFTPHKNGIEAYIRTYAKALAKHGVKTTVVTYDQETLPMRDRVDDIDVYRLPSRTLLGGTQIIGRRNATYKTVMREIEMLDVDAVMTHTRFFPITQRGTRFAKRHGLPLIHVEHGNRHIPHPNPAVRVDAWIYDHTLGRWTMKHADQVIAISKPGVEFCKHLGASPEHVTYIPNAIDMQHLKPVKSATRKNLGIAKDRYVIAFVGRLIKAKGVQDLFAATTDMDVDVIIVGDGVYRQKLERMAENITPRVHFLGELDRKDVIKVLSIADLFVNPSYAEGLPTSVLEAAALGVPVVATDVGGTREIITGQDLVAPGAVRALQRRIRWHKQERSAAAQKAERIKKEIRTAFDAQTNAQRLFDVLETVI